MADFNALKRLIDAYIKRNGVKAITGQILNGVLNGMVNALGKGYTVAGSATPNTDPGTMTGPLAYFAYTAGTYTNFGNLEVANGEFSLLIYDEAEWHKEVLYSLAAEATVDANVGTPEVGVSFENGVLSFDFRNMKGNTGDAAGFGTVNATVDANIGTPGVVVQTSGPDTAKNITFAFRNLKGETGVTSVIATVDNTTGNPACAVSLNGQELHLDFTGLKGAQGDTGSSVDYPFTIVNNLTTDDATQALSAAMGVELAGQVSQLEAKVNEINIRNEEGSQLADLDIVDDNDKVLVRFADGHARTKNFDSKRVAESLDNGQTNDLTLVDEQGNRICVFADGHIRTKNFNSKDSLKHLTLFILGNSYCADAYSYVPFILKKYGITCHIAYCYYGGAYIDWYIANFNNANGAILYSIDTRTESAWKSIADKSPKQMLATGKWDIVALQQASAYSVLETSFDNVDDLIRLVKNECNYPFTLGWSVNFSRYEDDEPQTILTNIKNACKSNPIDFIIPFGTAIFNARTNATLAALGDGAHHNLWGDDVHLQEGLPCYIAALAVVQAIFNKYYPTYSVLNEDTRVTDEWNADKGFPFQTTQPLVTGGIIATTDELAYLAQKAAILAARDNFEIINI